MFADLKVVEERLARTDYCLRHRHLAITKLPPTTSLQVIVSSKHTGVFKRLIQSYEHSENRQGEYIVKCKSISGKISNFRPYFYANTSLHTL